MKDYKTYIEINSKKMVGKPVIKDTRITVELVLHLLAQGATFDEIIGIYPHLKKEQILACLEYATQILEAEKVFPIKFYKREKVTIH